MARQQPTRPTVSEYHVYDKDAVVLGGIPVINKGDGSRVVRMTTQQAKYFIDAGAIGVRPERDLPDVARAAHAQFRGK